MITSGASEALHLAIEALCGKGDEVLVPDPGFVSYSALTVLADATPVGVPLGERLRYDPETLKEYITGRTRAIVLNSPSNPTGTIQTKAEVKAIAEIAEDKDITVISDEVYEHFIYDGEHVSPGQFSDNVITVNAASKTYAMTGWRIGYVAARPEYTEQMIKVHQYVQACACSVSQKAALAAITGPQESVGIMRDEFRKRRDYLVTELNAMGVACVRPQGAFYAFPKVGDEARVVTELIKKGVIATPGTAFGTCGKGYMRLAYATSMANITEGCRHHEDGEDGLISPAEVDRYIGHLAHSGRSGSFFRSARWPGRRSRRFRGPIALRLYVSHLDDGHHNGDYQQYQYLHFVFPVRCLTGMLK